MHHLSLRDLGDALRGNALTPTELTEHYLARIDRLDEAVGAFLTVTPTAARAAAKAAEERLARTADPHPLLGIPVAVKDLTPVAGHRHTSGSAAFADRTATTTAHVAALLLDRAGMPLLGKTSAPEFGCPAYTEPGFAPPARSPFDPTRSAGGSSGGAAAAVAAGLVPAAHGSDGGGSLRIPAAACGIVGFKPSRGRVSPAPGGDPTGLTVAGPLARSVRDAALLLDAMAVPAPGDPYAAPPLPPGATFAALTERAPAHLRIAAWTDTGLPGVAPAPEVLAAHRGTVALLRDLGHTVEELPRAPLTAADRDGFAALWGALAASVPVPDGAEELLMPLTRWLRQRGRAVSGTDWIAALDAMQTTARTIVRAVDGYDAVLTPALAALPAKVGALRNDDDPAADFDAQTAYTPYTAPWNWTGWPAVALPLHWTDPTPTAPSGLPVAAQLAAPHGADARLLALAAQLEEARPWAARRPVVH
ncbi:amidase [Mangrovactinospora gilvigrisea]|nr:amidase [Mangrovactinospora gilvigrisea]